MNILKQLLLHYGLILFIAANMYGMHYLWNSEWGSILTKVVGVFLVVDILYAGYFIILLYIKWFGEIRMYYYEN